MKKLIYKDIFAQVEVVKAFMKRKQNGEDIYKMLNVWLRNCRSIPAFMKKEIEYTKRERETGGKMLEDEVTKLALFNSIFMNNKGPSHI